MKYRKSGRPKKSKIPSGSVQEVDGSGLGGNGIIEHAYRLKYVKGVWVTR